MRPGHLLPALSLFSSVFFNAFQSAHAQEPGSISIVGNTLVSAMMMLLGNEDKVYIVDKAEANPTQINGHSAWASEWDLNKDTARALPMYTNPFCASGMFLPNGSWATFGGNSAVLKGGADAHEYSADYNVYDGRTTIRIMDPCPTGQTCNWYDDATFLHMTSPRWYSTAEPLADGSIAIIGGFVNGGYINRWNGGIPDWCKPGEEDTQCGMSEPSSEFFPANGRGKRTMPFLIRTGGLNSYPHAFLMPDGRMLLQANVSTILWDPVSNKETPLPDMPGNVVRVYPASGAVAMLPLTPANNYTPTVIFCGGSDMPDEGWGGYGGPRFDTWLYPASKDCHRITATSDNAQWEKDDDLPIQRTMGQFVALPDGKLLIINGGLNGTAGYATETAFSKNLVNTPLGVSLADGPVLTPALYDPNAPKGQRWSNPGYSASTIPRMYHSGALLLPDTSIFVAGSNPNPDFDDNTKYNTEYRAEKFYPHYYKTERPPISAISGIPQKLSYGGDYFNLTVSGAAYSGDPNEVAGNITVVIIRSGFTTHAMNMGQRMMQLENTFTVQDDGNITLHVSQLPPNPNLITPGPVYMYIVVRGLPSNGKYVLVGSGGVGQQPTAPNAPLPISAISKKASNNSGSGTKGSGTSSSGISKTLIIGAAAGALALLIILGIILGLCIRKKRKTAAKGGKFVAPDVTGYRDLHGPPMSATGGQYAAVKTGFDPSKYNDSIYGSETASVAPFNRNYNDSANWSPGPGSRQGTPQPGPGPAYSDFDPYRDFPNADASSQYSRPSILARDSFVAPFPTRPGSMAGSSMRDSYVGTPGPFQGGPQHQQHDSMDDVQLRTPSSGGQTPSPYHGQSSRPVSQFGIQMGVALSDPPVPSPSGPIPINVQEPSESSMHTAYSTGPPPTSQQLGVRPMVSSASLGNMGSARIVPQPSPSPSHPELYPHGS